MKFLKSIFNLDAFWATLVLYILMFTVPLIFSFSVFNPFTKAMEDFKIGDMYYSSILPELEIPEETEIVLINSVTFSPFGQKDLSTENLARFVLMAQDAGAMAVGVNAELDFDTSMEDAEIMVEIFSQEGVILAKDKVSVDGEPVGEAGSEAIDISSLVVRNTEFIGQTDRKKASIRSFIPKTYTESGERHLHFALRLANHYNPSAVDRILEQDEDETVINYRGNYDKFYTLEASEFFSGDYVETYGEDFLQNKIVIIGDFDVSGKSDEFSKIYYTPMNENVDGRTFPDMYETMILANITSMAISDEYLEAGSDWKHYVLGFIMAYINMLIYIFIARRDRKWLEFAALLIFVVESIVIAWIIVELISSYSVYEDMTFLIFVAALAPIIFQLYMDTIRPLMRRLLNLFS